MSHYQLLVLSNSLSLQLRHPGNAWGQILIGSFFSVASCVMMVIATANWSRFDGFWKCALFCLVLIITALMFFAGFSMCRKARSIALSADIEIKREEADKVVVKVEERFLGGRSKLRSIEIQDPQKPLASAGQETIHDVKHGGHWTRHYLRFNLVGRSGQAYYRAFNDLANGPSGISLREQEAASIVKLLNGFAARGYAVVGELTSAERSAAGVFA